MNTLLFIPMHLFTMENVSLGSGYFDELYLFLMNDHFEFKVHLSTVLK